MPFLPLRFAPGINREGTAYSNKGGWFDCNRMRFRSGLPEQIGGWVRYLTNSFLGVARAIWSWVDLSQLEHIAVGTHLKYYIVNGTTPYDVTPLKPGNPVSLGNNPFTSVNGSPVVTVHSVGHGEIQNDFVTFSGATTFNGIPAANLNTNLQITTIVDANNYTVNVGINANASSAGGGAAVTAAYEIDVGLIGTAPGNGWGAGPWGNTNGWGTPYGQATVTTAIRLWTQRNFGQDLIFAPRFGQIYYWFATSPTARATLLSTQAGASDVPTEVTEIFVSQENRMVIAFGCTPPGSGIFDPLFIRWTDFQNAVQWTPLPSNAAGGIRVSYGSQIITAMQTHQEILVFTDVSVHSMQYIGFPFYWTVTLIENGAAIIGPGAKAQANNGVFWMGINNFFFYNGNVQPVPCTVKDYVFGNMDAAQTQKIIAVSNNAFNEVWWFYASVGSTDVDSYVAFNYLENVWFYGKMPRTAWLDRGIDKFPLAVGLDGFMYQHEIGASDGSTSPESSLNAYITSSPFEIDPEGDNFMFVNKVLPDLTFRSFLTTTAAIPAINFTFMPVNYPGGAIVIPQDTVVLTRSQTVPIEQYTQWADLRLRGRAMIFQASNPNADVGFRLGVPRLQMRPDGKKS